MENRQNNHTQSLTRVETTQFVLPEHLNHMENMHGGEILKLMDNTAGLAFIRYAGGDAVTAGIEQVKFIQPIPHKSIIKCTAEVVATGKTSMKIYVAVFIEELGTGNLIKATEGMFTGVAIDKQGKPRPVKPIIEASKTMN